MVRKIEGGRYQFRIYQPHATCIELIGDFTGWGEHPIALACEESEGENGRGWWHAECEVPPGDHRFTYRINGSLHLPDYAASGVQRDSHGSWVSLISIPEEADAMAICGQCPHKRRAVELAQKVDRLERAAALAGAVTSAPPWRPGSERSAADIIRSAAPSEPRRTARAGRDR